ncbi:2-cysteine peroxiredoxin [Lactarius hatsudake]|nr:2-cysteine peroxiredoxin [Lactarius hatsudake]
MSPTIQSPTPVFSVTALIHRWFFQGGLTGGLSRVILMFYPLDFTFVCPTEILAFNDALPEFARLNTMYSHYAWAQQVRSAGGLGPDLRIPLLADRNMRVARDNGCLIEDKGITFRASYLIDPKSILSNLKDAHGEVCPANWKEGGKTIRADPLAKLDYFAATADGAHENGKANGTKRARMDTE